MGCVSVAQYKSKHANKLKRISLECCYNILCLIPNIQMEFNIAPECAAQSVGPANQLFGLLIQTLLAAQCNISPSNKWPEDYGEELLKKGYSS